jgi:hypothetical protein
MMIFVCTNAQPFCQGNDMSLELELNCHCRADPKMFARRREQGWSMAYAIALGHSSSSVRMDTILCSPCCLNALAVHL